MRCQWGTTWENMQPWIVARRYREFDVLNFQVMYGHSASVLIVLIHSVETSNFIWNDMCTAYCIIHFFFTISFFFTLTSTSISFLFLSHLSSIFYFLHRSSFSYLSSLPPSVATLFPLPSQCNAHTPWERFLQLPWCTRCGQEKKSIGRIYDPHRAKAAHCKSATLSISIHPSSCSCIPSFDSLSYNCEDIHLSMKASANFFFDRLFVYYLLELPFIS